MWEDYGLIQTVKQASWILLLSLVIGYGQSEDAAFAARYEAPVVDRALFGDDVMLAAERKSYATNLATYVANMVSSKGAAKDVLLSARQILALALHLERRNKQAMVVNFQLRQGVMPKVKVGDYNPRTFSRLLMARAKLLLKGGEGSKKERLLGRYLSMLQRTSIREMRTLSLSAKTSVLISVTWIGGFSPHRLQNREEHRKIRTPKISRFLTGWKGAQGIDSASCGGWPARCQIVGGRPVS